MSLELKVMTFNIRYAHPGDGPNHWELRRDAVVELIEAWQPDLLGCQEVTLPQRAFLDERLAPTYQGVGLGRDGQNQGEQATLYWRADRLRLRDWWTRWLSPTPEVPGSRGWDAMLARTVTLARLEFLARPGRTLLAANTHLDHAGARSREESAALLRDWLEQEGRPGEARILLGDFNAGEAERPIVSLSASLTDTFRAAAPQAGPRQAGTYHAFLGLFYPEPLRIDYIFADPAARVLASQVVRSPGRHRGYPSDHYPVCSRLAW